MLFRIVVLLAICKNVQYVTFRKMTCLNLPPLFFFVEMYEIQCGCSYLAVQAADPVHSQPKPEGCTQLWPIPAGLQWQGWKVFG